MREYRRGAVMPMPGPGVRREPGEDDVRLEFTDDPHGVTQHLLFVPGLQRLIRRLAKPKIKGTREELFGAIHPPRRQHLLRPDEAQFYSLFITNEILTAIPARHGKIPRTIQPVLRHVSD